jgi:hypothetical protein
MIHEFLPRNDVKKICLIVLGLFLGISNAQESAIALKKKHPDTFFQTKEQAIKAAGLEHQLSKENQDFATRVQARYDAIKKSVGANFAGSWIEYDEKKLAYQVLAVTQSTKIPKSFTTEYRLKIVYFKYSLEELNLLEDKIDRHYFKAPFKPRLFGSYVNEKNNTVTILLPATDFDAFRATLIRDGFDIHMISLEAKNRPALPAKNL